MRNDPCVQASPRAEAGIGQRPCLTLVSVHVVDGQLNGSDFFGFFVRDFATEGFFQSHNQFYGIQRVCAQVVLEGRFIFDFGFVYAQLFSNNFFNLLFDVFA